MPHIKWQREDKTLGQSIKHTLKRNRHVDVVLLHRELYLNLNRHIRHGRALTKRTDIGVVHTKYNRR